MDKDLLIRYIKGLVSPAEREMILNWIDESRENADFFSRLKADFTIENLPCTETPDKIIKKINSRIRPAKSFIGTISKVAALLLLPVTLFSVYQYIHYTGKSAGKIYGDVIIKDTLISLPDQTKPVIDYRVNPGVKGMVLLPDGSKVWLNSDSYLKCPGEFDSTHRMVELTGEGYFNIVSNKSWPMYVKTSKGITVKVTGTEFNISSYDNDDVLKFTLVSGEVELLREGTKQIYLVNRSEEIVIPDNVNYKGKRLIADIYTNTAWKDGHLIFDNTPMPEVIKKVQRWYGVKINIEDEQILSYSFTADFSSESVTQVLELIKITSNVQYSVKGNRINLQLQKN